MGYCMQQRNSIFTIEKENVPKALEAIKKLVEKVDMLGGGGSYGPNGKTSSHYSWVDTLSFLKAETFQKAMEEWRWDVEVDATGEVNNIYFRGEKLGDDKILFDAIAPFVEKGSFIEMDGEDGTLWRWNFDGKHCVEKSPQITW